MFLRETPIVFRRQSRIALRNPAWVIIGLVQPILYLALFGPLLEPLARSLGTDDAYVVFVPGLLVQLGLFGALFTGFSLVAEWRAGVIEAERVTPASRTAPLLGAACACASNAIGLITKSEDVLAPLLNSIALPVSLLSGILLPITAGAPAWLEVLSNIVPTKHVVDGIGTVFTGAFDSTLWWGVFWSVVVFAAAAGWATRVFRRENG